MKSLCIDHGLIGELSRSLRPDDGELPLELLPELQELTFTGSSYASDAFTSFIDARQNAGHPVTLAHSAGIFKVVMLFAPVITSGSSEAENARDTLTRKSCASHQAAHPTPVLLPTSFYPCKLSSPLDQCRSQRGSCDPSDLSHPRKNVVVYFLYSRLPSSFVCYLGFLDHSLSYCTLR